MAVASSSVAQVTTRRACSLSKAASTVFWWVSGTLRIQPSSAQAGAPQPSAARWARASRKVSLSVAMMSDAGIESGIPASPGKVGCILLEDSAFQKGVPMRRTIACIVALVSLSVAGAATGQEPKTEEQKTFYALGLAISQNLGSFNLSEAE